MLVALILAALKSFSTRLIGYCRVIPNASNDLEKLFKLGKAAH